MSSKKITQTELNTLTNNHIQCLRDDMPLAIGDVIENCNIKQIPLDGYTFNVDPTNRNRMEGANSPIGYPTYLYYTTNTPELLEVDVTNFDAGYYNFFTFSMIEPVVPDYYVIQQKDLDEANQNGVNMFIDGAPLAVGDGLVDCDLTIEAQDGYLLVEFDSSGYILANGFDGGRDQVSGRDIRFYFDVAEDKLTGSHTIDGEWTYDGNFFFTTVIRPEDDSLLSISKAYVVTDDNIRGIQTDRFQTLTDVNGETIDNGKYLLSIRQFPVSIPDEYLGTENNIVMGLVETDEIAPVIIKQHFYVNGGEISVAGEHGNLLDYLNKTIVLHLPFLESVELPVEYVIDSTLTITYKISVYTGDCVAFIYSSKGGNIIETVSGQLGIDVPYSSFLSADDISNGNTGGSILNDIKTASLEIVKTDFANVDGVFTTPIQCDEVLSNTSGFTVVDNIELNVNCSTEEKNLILNVLTNGVINNV